jgi:hypothetical protein
MLGNLVGADGNEGRIGAQVTTVIDERTIRFPGHKNIDFTSDRIKKELGSLAS